jgi:hypothetical protein
MSVLVVAFSEEMDEDKLSLSLMVAFKCLPNGFGSRLVRHLREYMIENLEEYVGDTHPQKRVEALRKKGYRIYELNLDAEDENWIASLLYQTQFKLKTSRMQVWTYKLGMVE